MNKLLVITSTTKMQIFIVTVVLLKLVVICVCRKTRSKIFLVLQALETDLLKWAQQLRLVSYYW